MPRKITKKPQEDEYTTIKIPNDLVIAIDRLIGTRGYKSRGEIVKEALRIFLDKFEKEEQFQMLNHDSEGVKVWDRKLRRVADIIFKPNTIYCTVCDAHYCEHIRYALSQPDIQQLIKKKKEEGWQINPPEI